MSIHVLVQVGPSVLPHHLLAGSATPSYVARQGRVWSTILNMPVCPQAERWRIIERALERRADSRRWWWSAERVQLNRRMTARYLRDLVELKRALREIIQ